MYSVKEYKIGYEKGVGRMGNAPYLLYDSLPLDFSFFLLTVSASASFLGTIELGSSLYLILFWFLYFFVIILLIIVSFQLILRYRFRKPYTSHELEEVMSRASKRMGFSRCVELWLLHGNKQVLLPLSGLLYRSIVISKQAEEDLLASPENAEIILADNLKDLEGQPVPSTWLPVAVFVPFSFLLVQWTGLTTSLAIGIFSVFYWIIVVIGGIRLALGGGRRKKNPILTEYGTHPDVARCFVFRKSAPTEDELQSIFRVRHEPFDIAGNRLAGIFSYLSAVLISAGVGFVLMQRISFILSLFTQFEVVSEALLFVTFTITLAVFWGTFYYFTKRLYVTNDSN
jgi:hypothetical protein